MHEPILKKKDIIKAQYIYNIFLLLVLSLGVSYALVTFLHNEQGFKATITSSLVKITVDEDTSFSLTNTSPVSDEEGLQGYSKTLTLTNTATIDSLTTITINPETSNNIDTSYINYGLYINGVLKKTGNLTNPTIYDGMLLQGEKVTFEVYLWVDEAYTGTGTTFNGTFEVDSKETVITMADYVTKLVDKGKGVYKIDNDYRYSGTNPHNYIWFNCKEGTTGGSNNCELWQIVGSLETKANEYANSYRRIKLVKVDNLSSQTFGSNNTFSGSSIDTYLNDTYYTSLTEQSQKMVISSEWNVGGSSLTNTPKDSLTSERASKVYKKVGLLSASDIGYSTNTDNQSKSLDDADLYTNSWLKGSSYYTLTPISGNTTSVIGNNSISIANLTVTTASGVKPSIYLIPNVYIKAGNGTQNMPYEIELVNEEEHYSNVAVLGYITYDVNGQEVEAPKIQPIFADGSTVIKGELADTSEIKFKGWATSIDGEVVYKSGDKVVEKSNVTLYAVWQILEKLVTKITNTLTLTDASEDIDGTRYVTGDKNASNHVWYSGKLWRIVAINGDGSIKLVTQGNMTSIAWDVNDSTDYSTSQVHKWLNSEFLPTLETSVLVDSTWDYTSYTEATTTKVIPVNYVENEKVGLLTIYDYYKVRNDSNSNFLNNGYNWWTMSPIGSVYVSLVNNIGNRESNSTSYRYGIRPSVNLKSDIQIMGGNGTKSNPYVIEGDKDIGATSEFLNNRISGEYINFNDVLYRIVGTEEIKEQKLTKITMADYSLNKNTLTSMAFGSESSQRIFSPTYGIGLYLEEWYQADSTSDTYSTIYIKDDYKAMIATGEENGVAWYTGPTSPTSPRDYTLSKTGTPVSATIGLPYYGEMFSSQFGDGYGSSTYTWLMTIYSDMFVWVVDDIDANSWNNTSNSYGVRPSFYLKSNVVITSGSGMPHDPYQIETAIPIGYITYNASGVDVTVPNKTPIYDGINTIINTTLDDTSEYYFMGWSTSPNGEVMYQKGDVINVTSDITLYAIWKEIKIYNFAEYYIAMPSTFGGMIDYGVPTRNITSSASTVISNEIPDDVYTINVIDMYALHSQGYISSGVINFTGLLYSNYDELIDRDFCETNPGVCTTYSKNEFIYLADKWYAGGSSIATEDYMTFSYNSSDKKLYIQNGNGNKTFYLAIQFVVPGYAPSEWEHFTNSQPCLHADTAVYVYDRKKKKFKKKKIKDVTYDDELLVWDFDKGEFSLAKPVWIKKKQTTDKYNLLTFSDGSRLRTINQHRIFNKEKGMFTLCMTEDTPIGTTTLNSKGEYVTLVSKKVINKEVDYYNVITDYHINLFTDNILTSCRLSNIYKIEDLKYIKEERNNDVDSDINIKWVKGLRLSEQPIDINRDDSIKYNDIKEYVNNLEKLDVNNQ